MANKTNKTDDKNRNLEEQVRRKKTQLRGILISERGTVELRVIKAENTEEENEAIYRMLEIEYMELPRRSIGGVNYYIICDEEGALKDDPVPTVFREDHTPDIFGNVFICRSEGPNLASLTRDDIKNIFTHIQGQISICMNDWEGCMRFVLAGVEAPR